MARINEILNYDSRYRENEVLKNKLGINDSKKLEEMERMLTSYKLANLYLDPGKQTFDVNHYLSIHKYLFEDIYDFAGEIRSENIQKVISFCLPHLIYDNLKRTLEKANFDSKKIKNKENLIDFITYYYSELDIIHPFMEGNGRTEREFLRQYVAKISENLEEDYTIDYGLIENKNDFIKAVIKADATCDLNDLKEYISSMIVNSKKKSR